MVREDELRFYWSRRLRGWAVAGVDVGILGLALSTITAWSRWPVLLPVDGAFIAVSAGFLRAVWRSGVRETKDGLIGGVGRYRKEYAWDEMVGFGYAPGGVRSLVFAKLADGSRGVIRGGWRRMRWHHGRTLDFAALLEERRRLFVETPGTSAA